MLTSTFDDTPSAGAPREATLEGEGGLFRRLEGADDRKPGWIVPAAGVAVVGGLAAAALLLTAPQGRNPAPTGDLASAAPIGVRTLATTTSMATSEARPMQTASVTASIDPNRPVAPQASRPAPRATPAPVHAPPREETLTSVPAESPAPNASAPPRTETPTVAPTGPAMILPPAAETPVARPAPPANDSAPADAPPAAASPPVAPSEPGL